MEEGKNHNRHNVTGQKGKCYTENISCSGGHVKWHTKAATGSVWGSLDLFKTCGALSFTW